MADRQPRRNTRQRQAVLEELRKLASHPTAAELHEVTRRRLPTISLGTVYRNLELLAQMGVIRRIEISGSKTRFDGDADQHYHVRCVRCGQLDDADELPTEPLKEFNSRVNDYKVLGFRLELFGICPKCQAEPAPGNVAAPFSENEG